jgi:hypothetical protein
MIDLPSYPPPAAAQPSFLDRGVTLEGAVDQRVDRMGSRFGLSVSMPPMKGSKLGRQWIAALMRGKNEGVRLRWPLQGFKPGIPGAVKVNGAGQSGRTLVVDGATPNYVFRAGQPFNHVPADGEELLYFVTEEAIANGSGEAELTIEPMLRVEPADDDDLEFGVPVICGFLASGDLPWDLGVAQQVGLGFAIKERR